MSAIYTVRVNASKIPTILRDFEKRLEIRNAKDLVENVFSTSKVDDRTGKLRSAVGGYLFVRIKDEKNLNKLGEIIKEVDGMYGFLMAPAKPGSKPNPVKMTAKQEQELLNLEERIETNKVKINTDIKVGTLVEYEGFTGVIKEISDDKTKFIISVKIFNQDTDIEVESNSKMLKIVDSH